MVNEAVKTSNVKRNAALVIAAFAAVYIIWGSTYLGIKIAIESMPPLLMAGVRFVTAGVILFAWARSSKDYEKPKAAHWKTSFIVGTLLLLGGNGAVVFAEGHISSSLAALLVATEPFWVVLLGWLWLKGSRPNLRVVLGLAVGFVGVCLLIGGSPVQASAGDSSVTLAIVVLMLGSLAWACGSLYGLRAPVPRSTIQTAGMQMLAGGTVLMAASLVFGEWSHLDLAKISSNSIFALIYLIVFGAILGYTAYSWLLKNVKPAAVATYAYVNPAIAVVLGWLVAGESMTGEMLLGAGVIVGSVALVTSTGRSKRNAVSDPEDEDVETPSGMTGGTRTVSAAA